MKILVINAGSSSLKYQLIDMDNEQVMAKGLCERIGIEGSNLQHTNVAKDEKTKIEKPMKDHGDAIQMVIDALVDEKNRCYQVNGRNRCSRSQSCTRR